MRLEAVTVKNMCARKLQRLVQEALSYRRKPIRHLEARGIYDTTYTP